MHRVKQDIVEDRQDVDILTFSFENINLVFVFFFKQATGLVFCLFFCMLSFCFFFFFT